MTSPLVVYLLASDLNEDCIRTYPACYLALASGPCPEPPAFVQVVDQDSWLPKMYGERGGDDGTKQDFGSNGRVSTLSLTRRQKK